MAKIQSSNTLVDLVALLKGRFTGMLTIFTVVVLLVLVYTLVQTPVYEVVSSLMVKYGREYVYRSLDRGRNNGDTRHLYSFSGDTVINTEIEIFRSRELAAEVLDTLGVERLFPRLARRQGDDERLLPLAVKRFRKQLDVYHIKGSNVIGVAFRHRDPQIGVDVVNRLTELFKERHLQIFKNPKSPFLEEQVSLYRTKLAEAEEKLRLFRSENRIFAIGDQKSNLLRRYTDIRRRLADEKGRLVELARKQTAVEEYLAGVPERIEQFAESAQLQNIDDAKSRLLELKIKEHDLLARYPEDNRMVVATRENIEMIRGFIEEQDATTRDIVRTGRNPLYQQLEAELAAARIDYTAQLEKIEAFSQQLEQIDAELQRLTGRETQLAELQLQVEQNRESYKTFLGKLEDSRIQDALDREKMVNVVVIEKPMIPAKPVRPRKKLNLLVGIILGLACGLLYALVMGRPRTEN